MNILYRIFSYFLLIIGVFLGFSFLLAFLVALSYPQILITVFILLTVILYTFSSFLFLTRGIQGKQKFKPGFRDFIKVNALGSLVYVGRSMWDIIAFYKDPSQLKDFVSQISAMQNSVSAASEGEILSVAKLGIMFFIFYMSILVIHIVLTFFALKKHSALFEVSPKS
jgi:hypothetical protein